MFHGIAQGREITGILVESNFPSPTDHFTGVDGAVFTARWAKTYPIHFAPVKHPAAADHAFFNPIGENVNCYRPVVQDGEAAEECAANEAEGEQGFELYIRRAAQVCGAQHEQIEQQGRKKRDEDGRKPETARGGYGGAHGLSCLKW